MNDLRAAAQLALEALERNVQHKYPLETTKAIQLGQEAITALRAALEEQEQEPRWLTKELMADYLDMIAEAIEHDSSETLLHKAYWMRNRGEI
jgi:hypothetical protein